MADQAADPIAAVLQAVPTSDRVRAAAWDAFHEAKDRTELAARLKDIPIPEEVKAALWDAKPEMNFAKVNDVPLDTTAGPVERFAAGAVRANPVTNAVDMLHQLVTDPKAAGKAIVDPSVERIDRAVAAYKEGRPAAAVGNMAAAIPMIGPYVGGAVDRAQAGDVAGALGELSWMGLPALKKGGALAADAVTSGARTVAPDAMNALANMADRSANERLGKFISPQTGPNKVRFGRSAVTVAPDLLRDPALSAVTRGGLADKIRTRFEQAAEGLDTAADNRLASQQVKTAPILRQIDGQIGKLTATPVEGSRLLPSLEGTGGRPGAFPTAQSIESGTTSQLTPTARPIGQAVEPVPNRAQIDTLRQIRSEVSALGTVAPYESVRRIRQAWDKVAKVKYLPSTAQDALKSMGDADGAMSGTAAMREALAAADPESAQAYHAYNVYKSAHDVVQAAEEADRVRPNRGRGMLARTAGAMIGAKEGGVVGAGIGAAAAAIADKAVEMAPSVQVVIARRLAAVADALRSGDMPRAQQLTDRVVLQFPAIKSTLKIVGTGAAMLGRSTKLPAALAAEQRAQAQKSDQAAVK